MTTYDPTTWEVWVQDTDPSTFTFLNDDATRADLTSTTIRLSIEMPNDSFVLVTGVDAEIVISDQTDPDTKGMVVVTLSAAQRARLVVEGENLFQIQRIDGTLKRSSPYGTIDAMKWVENA